MYDPAPPDLVQKAQDAFGFAERQLLRLITNHPGYFPLFTKNGRWRHDSESWTNWCEGFLGGMLWIIARRSNDPWWREKAEEYSRLIGPRKTDRNVHDLGFLFLPTWKVWFELTGESSLQKTVLEAGKTLAMRFQRNGRYLRSFVAPESLFIDIMMNVEIIFYTAAQLEDRLLYEIALDHCLTTRRYLVRGDGSTAHEGMFNIETGEFLRQSTHQGWRGDSCWARGQAWALFGFSTTYACTKDARFLETAKACADYFIANTPDHGIPPNDWDEAKHLVNKEGPVYESSAAAIAVCGFLQIADQIDNQAVATRYRERAWRTLSTLLSSEFLAEHTPGWEGILKHGIYHKRKHIGVDESVMWGDYFLLSALDRLTRFRFSN